MAGAVDIDPAEHPLPEPLREQPPADRYCDLVLTGGVASGVVYPWAVLELARAFHLRNVGGTSVGAMAAALAAACEYGRRNGHAQAYEVMRRLPRELAEGVVDPVDGVVRTRMLTLFQPRSEGRRPFRLVLALLDLHYNNPGADAGPPSPVPTEDHRRGCLSVIATWMAKLRRVGKCLRLFDHSYKFSRGLREAAAIATFGGLALALWAVVVWTGVAAPIAPALAGLFCAALLWVPGMVLWTLVRFGRDIAGDLRAGVLANDLGLCKGRAAPVEDEKPVPGLVDWLDEGIQQAAGLPVGGPPLTFEDLWHAPLRPGGPRPEIDRDGLLRERSINLQMVTTNVTHGRPYRLPLADPDARLFFRRSEWSEYLPAHVLDALCQASEPYRPKSRADPITPRDPDGRLVDDLLEMPGARMPIVVAARLSLSYPLLFSAPPLHAIDYEVKVAEARPLRRCRFSDGGLSSNFPVHFFDSALPRWPTFGIWLERRSPFRMEEPVWLPQHAGQGRGDRWQRFEPGPVVSGGGRPEQPIGTGTLVRFLVSALIAAKDWKDHTSMRMPHVRRRVARVGLLDGEGELNIGMPASMIMSMAAQYGTASGCLLRKAFVPAAESSGPAPAWREHLWIRFTTLLDGLADLFRRFDMAASDDGHSIALRRLLQEAQHQPVLSSRTDTRCLSDVQVRALTDLVDKLEALQASLQSRPAMPHRQRPEPELRLRPPL